MSPYFSQFLKPLRHEVGKHHMCVLNRPVLAHRRGHDYGHVAEPSKLSAVKAQQTEDRPPLPANPFGCSNDVDRVTASGDRQERVTTPKKHLELRHEHVLKASVVSDGCEKRMVSRK